MAVTLGIFLFALLMTGLACILAFYAATWGDPFRRAPAFPRRKETVPKDAVIYDALIVGGGPAGASAALVLARSGQRVLVLEKHPMPRRKACGGALSRRAMAWLGMELPENLIDQKIHAARLSYGPHTIEKRINSTACVLVSRARFDHYLLTQAQATGAQVVFFAAKEVVKTAGLFQVTTASGQYYSRALIVAEGAVGRFHKYLRASDDMETRGYCLEADIPVEEADTHASLCDTLDLHFGVADYGYGWVFHHGAYCSVGIGGLAARMKTARDSYNRFLSQQGFPPDPTGARGAYLPRGGVCRRVHGDGCLLVGDAAGFVDPLYGEGLAFAIRSGQIAGETLLAASASGDWSDRALSAYARRCHKEFGADLRYALWISTLTYCLPDAVIRALTTDPEVLDRFLDVGLGRSRYRDLFFWVLPRLPRLLLGGRGMPAPSPPGRGLG